MPRPDTAHWRRCDDAECIVCASRRREFEEEARRRLQDVDVETRIQLLTNHESNE